MASFGKILIKVETNPQLYTNWGIRFVKRQKQIALNNPNNLAIQRAALVSAQELVTLREEAQKYHELRIKYSGKKLTRREVLTREAAAVGLTIPEKKPVGKFDPHDPLGDLVDDEE